MSRTHLAALAALLVTACRPGARSEHAEGGHEHGAAPLSFTHFATTFGDAATRLSLGRVSLTIPNFMGGPNHAKPKPNAKGLR